MIDSISDFIKQFHSERCGRIKIKNEQQYQSLLYKTLVVNLTIFDEYNWGDFDFTLWIAAINLYEFENNLPNQYAKLRELLESKHKGFCIEAEDSISWLNTNENYQPTAQVNSSMYDLITNKYDYLYHLHKSIEVMFYGTTEDKKSTTIPNGGKP